MRRFNVGDVIICAVFILGLGLTYKFIGFTGLIILLIKKGRNEK